MAKDQTQTVRQELFAKFGTWCKVAWPLDPLGIATALTHLQAPAHGGKECYGDALEARKCFLRECRSGNGGKEGGEHEDDDDEIAVMGDYYILI